MIEFGSGSNQKPSRARTRLERWAIDIAATAIAAGPVVFLALKSDPSSVWRFNSRMLEIGVAGLVALGIIGHAFRFFETIRYRRTASSLDEAMDMGDTASRHLDEVMHDLAAISGTPPATGARQ